MSSLGRNGAANLLARAWGAAASFIFIPVYIHVLGHEAFGLVSFFATLQVGLTVAFTGWTKSLRRQFALDEASLPRGLGRRAVLRSFEVIYGVSALVIVAIGAVVSAVLSNHWLTYHELTRRSVFVSLVLMSCSVGVQLLAQAYSSALNGLQEQVRAVTAEISWSLLRAATAVGLALLAGGAVIAFFVGFLLVDVLYAAAGRLLLRPSMRAARPEEWSPRAIPLLRALAPMSLGMTVIAIAYLVNTQVDRIFLGRLLGVDAVGSYAAAAALGQLPVVASTAVAVTAFPVLVATYSSGDLPRLRRQTIAFARAANVIATAASAFLIVFGEDFLTAWLRDPSLVASASTASVGLVVGGYMLALQQIPYEYLVARGITRINVTMSLLCVPWSLLVTPVAVARGGLHGASLSWAVLMGACTLIYLTLVGTRFLQRRPLRTLTTEILVPMSVLLLLAVGVRQFTLWVGLSSLERLLVGVAAGALGMAVYGAVSLPFLRTRLLNMRRHA